MTRAKPEYELIFGDDPKRGGFRLISGGDDLSSDRLRSLEALAALRPGTAIHRPERRMGPLGKYYVDIRYDTLAGARVGSITAKVRVYSGVDPLKLVGGSDAVVSALRAFAARPIVELVHVIDGLLLASTGSAGVFELPFEGEEGLKGLLGMLPFNIRSQLALSTSPALGKDVDRAILIESSPEAGLLRVVGVAGEGKPTRTGLVIARLLAVAPDQLEQIYIHLDGVDCGLKDLPALLCGFAAIEGVEVCGLVQERDMATAARVLVAQPSARTAVVKALLLAGERQHRLARGRLSTLELVRELAKLKAAKVLDEDFVFEQLEFLVDCAGAWQGNDAGIDLMLAFAKPFEGDSILQKVYGLVSRLAAQNPALNLASPEELRSYLRGSRQLGLMLPDVADHLLVMAWNGSLSISNHMSKKEAQRHLPNSDISRRLLMRFLGPNDIKAFMAILKKSNRRYKRDPRNWSMDLEAVLGESTETSSINLEAVCEKAKPSWVEREGNIYYKVGRLAVDADKTQGRIILKTVLGQLIPKRGGAAGAAQVLAGAINALGAQERLDKAKVSDIVSAVRRHSPVPKPQKLSNRKTWLLLVFSISVIVALAGLVTYFFYFSSSQGYDGELGNGAQPAKEQEGNLIPGK